MNTTSTPQTFTITDQNNYPLGDPITVSLSANSSFALPSGSSCPASAQPCTLSIEFAPRSTGLNSDALKITDTATGVSAYVSLYGTGTQ